MSERVLASLEDEQGVCGSILMSNVLLGPIVVDVGLRPEHFYNSTLAEVYRAMLALHDRDETVDVQTTFTELERYAARRNAEQRISRGDVDLLTMHSGFATAGVSYAKRVKELATLRQKQHAAYAILEALGTEDWDALADAEGSLQVAEQRKTVWAPDEMGDEVVKFLNSDGGERWSLPWQKLTRALAGGLRRGTVTVVGGHSSHGKSAVSDDVLDTIVGRYGVKAQVYINEMTRHERQLRYVARRTGLDLSRLLQPDTAKLSGDDWKLILDAAKQFPWSLVEAEGWTGDEIARHLRQTRPDVALIDIFQLIATTRGETKDWDRVSRVLNAAAKQADCALIVTTHLNEARSETERPKPVLGDIRNTGQLKNDADTVLFVWREQERDLDGGVELLDDGVIYVAKARMGVPGVEQAVTFDGTHMRFLSRDAAPRATTPQDETEESPF